MCVKKQREHEKHRVVQTVQSAKQGNSVRNFLGKEFKEFFYRKKSSWVGKKYFLALIIKKVYKPTCGEFFPLGRLGERGGLMVPLVIDCNRLMVNG